MKNLFLIVLTLTVLTMFSTKRIHAKETTALIVIAADQSNSMFDTDSNHITIQREAIITALVNYTIDCNNLQVDCIAWGGSVATPVSAQLTSPKAVMDYALALEPVTHRMMSYTDHQVGLSAAVRQARESSAEKKVLIFITDGVSEMKHDFNLGQTIPADISVYTISLGTAEISTFVEKNIQPKTGGQHFHADDADELIGVLEKAFDAAKTELCLS